MVTLNSGTQDEARGLSSKTCGSSGLSPRHGRTGYPGAGPAPAPLRSPGLVPSTAHPETLWTARRGFVTKSIKTEMNTKHPTDSVEQRSYLESLLTPHEADPCGLGLTPLTVRSPPQGPLDWQRRRSRGHLAFGRGAVTICWK